MVLGNLSVNLHLGVICALQNMDWPFQFRFQNHLYANHLDQVELQLSRAELPLPQLLIKRKPDSLFDYQFEDFEFANYSFHPPIKAPIAV